MHSSVTLLCVAHKLRRSVAWGCQCKQGSCIVGLTSDKKIDAVSPATQDNSTQLLNVLVLGRLCCCTTLCEKGGSDAFCISAMTSNYIS